MPQRRFLRMFTAVKVSRLHIAPLAARATRAPASSSVIAQVSQHGRPRPSEMGAHPPLMSVRQSRQECRLSL